MKIAGIFTLNFPFHHPVARDFFIFAKKKHNVQNIQYTFPVCNHGSCRMWSFTGGYGQGKV